MLSSIPFSCLFSVLQLTGAGSPPTLRPFSGPLEATVEICGASGNSEKSVLNTLREREPVFDLQGPFHSAQFPLETAHRFLWKAGTVVFFLIWALVYVCIHLCICTCVCRHVHTCMSVYVEARGSCQLFSSVTLHLSQAVRVVRIL